MGTEIRTTKDVIKTAGRFAKAERLGFIQRIMTARRSAKGRLMFL